MCVRITSTSRRQVGVLMVRILPAHRTVMEYKYVVVHEATGEVQYWQPGDNLEVHVPEECAGTFVVKDDWVGTSRSIGVIEAPLPVVEPATPKVEEPASSRKDAEEAIANADVCCW